MALFCIVISNRISYSPLGDRGLTAAHAVPTIQTFVAGAATHGDVAAGITGWCIALHTF